MSKKLNDLIFDGYFTLTSKSTGHPEGNCKEVISKNKTNSNFEEKK